MKKILAALIIVAFATTSVYAADTTTHAKTKKMKKAKNTKHMKKMKKADSAAK